MSFSQSSHSISINNGTLHATCKNIQGQDCNSSLNLNNHISNNEGHLTWGGNGFINSSQNVQVNGNTLHARCQTSQGNWLDSSLNLDAHVGNNNGNLQC